MPKVLCIETWRRFQAGETYEIDDVLAAKLLTMGKIDLWKVGPNKTDSEKTPVKTIASKAKAKK